MTLLHNFKKKHSLVSTILAIMVGFSLVTVATLYVAVTTQAAREAKVLTANAANQTALVLNPMLAAQDWTSISVVLNELVKSPFLSGAALTDNTGKILVQTGAQTTHPLPVKLVYQSHEHGTMTLWIDPNHNQHQLMRILLLALAITFAAFAAVIYASALWVRNANIHLQQAKNELERLKQKQIVKDTLNKSKQKAESAQLDINNDPLISPLLSAEVPAVANEKPNTDTYPDEKVKASTEREAAEAEANIPEAAANEPSFSGYSIESQLENTLPEGEALYLFYIDINSGHAHYLEDDEKQQRVRSYQSIADKIATSYGSALQPLDDGNFCMVFKPTEKETQGIDAICAALTFTLTMKAVNKALVSKMSPVLNIRVALVRGTFQRPKSLLDEARYLTNHTETNELISHTALTETPFIQRNVLQGAKIKRNEEDKVEIISIEPRKQALFEEQAQQLCSIG